MGGHLTMVLRASDGTVSSKEAWTGSIFDVCSDPNILNLNEEEAKKIFSPLKYGDVPVDCEPVPEGYGIVVVDMLAKQILSCQGYTSLVGTSLSSERVDPCKFDRIFLMSQENRVNFLMRTFGRSSAKIDRFNLFPNPSSKRELEEIIEKGFLSLRLIVDFRPFKVVEYPDNAYGFRKMKKEMEKSGFTFSKEVKACWSKYIRGVE